MNLREIAAKKLTEQLLGDCEEEYRAMWHNARLAGNWPDFANDEESECFWNCLADEVSQLINDLQEQIKEDYGLDLKIYQYGRGGATIAPDGFSNNGNGHHFNRALDPWKIVDFNYYEDHEEENSEAGDWWVEAYQIAKPYLPAFKLINERVRSAVSSDLAEWWQKMKEANEWTFGEEEDEEPEDEAVNF